MISAVKNYGLSNMGMVNYQVMRSHAHSPRGYGSVGILRGEAAVTEIKIYFLVVVLEKSSYS